MAFGNKILVGVLMVMALCEVSMAVVHSVGDSTGWVLGRVNYSLWASTKIFTVGDTIIFTYNKEFHDVMQVTHSDFRSCNTTSPIATMTTGNDSITIPAFGHYYYICGVPGHCLGGQKVDIRVPRPSMPPTNPPITPAPWTPPVMPPSPPMMPPSPPMMPPSPPMMPTPPPSAPPSPPMMSPPFPEAPMAPAPAPSSGSSLTAASTGRLGASMAALVFVLTTLAY